MEAGEENSWGQIGVKFGEVQLRGGGALRGAEGGGGSDLGLVGE